MQFHHLPVAGGIYDQHPRLLEEWGVIWHAEYLHEKAKEAKEARKKDRGK